MFLRRNQSTELISDEQLAYVLTSTVCAHSVTWDDEREMYHFRMDGFDDIYLFEVTNIYHVDLYTQACKQ